MPRPDCSACGAALLADGRCAECAAAGLPPAAHPGTARAVTGEARPVISGTQHARLSVAPGVTAGDPDTSRDGLLGFAKFADTGPVYLAAQLVTDASIEHPALRDEPGPRPTVLLESDVQGSPHDPFRRSNAEIVGGYVQGLIEQVGPLMPGQRVPMTETDQRVVAYQAQVVSSRLRAAQQEAALLAYINPLWNNDTLQRQIDEALATLAPWRDKRFDDGNGG